LSRSFGAMTLLVGDKKGRTTGLWKTTPISCKGSPSEKLEAENQRAPAGYPPFTFTRTMAFKRYVLLLWRNKCQKYFDKKPHRRIVTPDCDEWIRM